MGVRQLRPTSAGTRLRSVADFAELTRSEPERSLLEPMKKSGGRNNQGHITVRRRGGGHRRRYRRIDFRRDKFGVAARVTTIEYDPNRTARIALLTYQDGEKRYILHPRDLQVGDVVVSGPGSDVRTGNTLPLAEVPLGMTVHCVELKRGRGAQICRSAGSGAQVMAREGAHVTVKLRSGEVRMVRGECMATVGAVSNPDRMNQTIGKAGRKRWMGVRPTVRGVAMNPVDHPHGGGEGRTSGGRHPVTPWGKGTKGTRTRNNKRTDRAIVRRRYQK